MSVAPQVDSHPSAEGVAAAQRRLAPHALKTPLIPSPFLSTAHPVYLKCENLQLTSSFKLRGALNKILALQDEGHHQKVVTASTGNHGAGVAYASRLVGADCVVFVPAGTPAAKIAAMVFFGAEVIEKGADCVVSEREARLFAATEGGTYIPPYNDKLIVEGQGTVGAELAEQTDHLDTVFVSLGGGGLVSGIGLALRDAWPGCKIVACSPENSAVMHASLQAGRILELESTTTLSDSTAGGVEPGSITFSLCQQLVAKSLLLSEDAIAKALRFMVNTHHILVEGAAAMAVAGYWQYLEQFGSAGRAGIILCGANIPPKTLAPHLMKNQSAEIE